MRRSGELLVVEEGKVVEGGVLPLRREDYMVRVEVRRGARIRRGLVAAHVAVYDEAVVEGGVLCEEFERVYGGGGPVVVRDGDLVGFVRVDAGEAGSGGVLLVVEGNVYSLGTVRLANTLVVGNVVAPRVEARRSVILGGVMGVEVEGRVPEVRLDGVLAYQVMSAGDIIVEGDSGVVLPMVYARGRLSLGASLRRVSLDELLAVASAARRGVLDYRVDALPVLLEAGVVEGKRLVNAALAAREELLDEEGVKRRFYEALRGV